MANQNNVLDETKKVLEMMEESEEKVSLLQQDLKQNESLCERIKVEVNGLRDLKNRNTADLEENQNLKSNIKKYNIKLVDFAQQIYSCGQQLYTEINLRGNELDEITEMFNKNEEKYLEKLNIHKVEEENLKAELDFLQKQEIKEMERKELESQKLATENEELKNELKNINEEIETCEKFIKKGTVHDLKEIKLKEEIANMKELIKLANDEMNEVPKLLEEIDKNMKKSETEASVCITELDKKIQEIENEIVIATKTLDENKTQYKQLLDKIKHIEGDKKEEEYKKYKNHLNDIEIGSKESEEVAKKEIAICEKSISEYKEMRKLQQKLNSKLRAEASLFTDKLEALNKEIKEIAADIGNLEAKKSKIDLNKELESKQLELKQLKSSRRELKDKYNKKLEEIQIETKKLKDEIEDIEMNNKKLQEDIYSVESEINQMRDTKEEKIAEKLKEEELSKQLDSQIRTLTSELIKIKSELANKRKSVGESKLKLAPKHLPNTSRAEKKPKVRHWDSDSSVEGEDRRFSELAKQKIRMRRLQGNRS